MHKAFLSLLSTFLKKNNVRNATYHPQLFHSWLKVEYNDFNNLKIDLAHSEIGTKVEMPYETKPPLIIA